MQITTRGNVSQTTSPDLGLDESQSAGISISPSMVHAIKKQALACSIDGGIKMESHGRIVGEKKKRQCPIGMGSCVRAECMWWCNATCVMVTIAEAAQEARR